MLEQLTVDDNKILEKELKAEEEKSLEEKWDLDWFWWEIKVTYIKDNVFSVEGKKKNITYYIDSNHDLIISVWYLLWINNYQKYTQILNIKNIKWQEWVYHMYHVDGKWSKQEIDKYSEKYFNIWMSIWFMIDRDAILKTYEWNTKKTVYKISDDTLDIFIKDESIRLIDLIIFQQKWNITKEQFIKYHKQLQWLLLEQIWDTRFQSLDNNSTITINNKHGIFDIDTSKVTISEIEFLYKLKIISGNIYKLAMEKLEELESLEEMKQIEINKQIWEDKKAIREL